MPMPPGAHNDTKQLLASGIGKRFKAVHQVVESINQFNYSIRFIDSLRLQVFAALCCGLGFAALQVLIDLW